MPINRILKHALIAGLLCFTGAVNAGVVNPAGTGIFVNLTSDGESIIENFWVTPDASSASIIEQILPTQGNQVIDDVEFGWDVSYNPDPFLFAQFSVTNLSASDKSFSLGSLVPISPAFASGFYGGSLDATLEDTSTATGVGIIGEASLTHGTPGAYKGQIDGSTVLNLFAIDMNCTSGAGCMDFGSDTDGLGGTIVNLGDPLPVGVDGMLLAAGPSNDIGIELDFILSAGDTVTFDAYFEVVPVPLPASAWLLVSSLGMLGWFRKIKQA